MQSYVYNLVNHAIIFNYFYSLVMLTRSVRHVTGNLFPYHLVRFNSSDSPASKIWFNEGPPRTDHAHPSSQLKNISACLGRFYSVPESIASRVISPFLAPELLRELRLFEDFSLLIRKPALDVMECLESAKLPNSVPRFVFYGQPGCGTSVQLAHVAHYAAEKSGLIFAFCNAENWLDRCSDFTPSNSYHQEQHKDFIEGDALDFPSRSEEWLRGFVKINSPILEKVCRYIYLDKSVGLFCM